MGNDPLFSLYDSSNTPLGTGTKNTWLNLSSLGTGAYTLVVSGSTNGKNAGYSGTFSVTAVPEPESYAMLLAGLGIMGVVARRRQKRS